MAGSGMFLPVGASALTGPVLSHLLNGEDRVLRKVKISAVISPLPQEA